MALTNGTKLGPYEILAPLGAGGMGEVYRARDTRLDRTVAIKVLPESFANDADRLQRFEQEARVLSALNHPNLLAIYDIGKQGGVQYLVFEFLEGQTLRERLGGGPLPQRRSIEYALQIANGLSAAHDKGIVHRDLKPENVFITRDERVKILDFGLAKQAPAAIAAPKDATLTGPAATAPGVVLGTVGYMSPEQVRAQVADHRSDIFSFGAMLYEMVSGKRAFRGESGVETMNAIVKEEPPELTDSGVRVSPGLERIVRRCLEKAPDRRFQSASDLAFAVETLSGASGALPAARPAKKIRYRSAVFAALAIILALSLGVFLGSRFARGPTAPVNFTRVSFRPGTVYSGRFAPDGETIVYTGAFDAQPPDLYTVRRDYPDSQPVGIRGAILLAVSRQGQMALLVKAVPLSHFTWEGTLAVAPLGGAAPRELAEQVTSADWSPDGNTLAVIRHTGTKYRLEYPAGKLLYETPNWLDAVRVSPDGAHLALFQHPPGVDDRGDLILVDSSGSARTLSTGWEAEEGLAWAPSGKEIWFSSSLGGYDYAIRAVSLSGVERVVSSQPGGVRIHDISPAGHTLLSYDQPVDRIDLVSHNSPPKDISWLDASWGSILSRDASLVALADQSAFGGNDYTVYIRKTDGSPAVRLGRGAALDISRDNRWVLAWQEKGGVVLLPVGAGEPRALHWDGIRVRLAAFFPDSQRLLLMASEGGSAGRLYLADVNGTRAKPLTGEFSPYNFIPISPDSRSFVYRANGQWLVQSLETGAAQPVPGLTAAEYVVRWSTDPKTIFVARPGDTEIAFYRVSVDSGKRELMQVLRPAAQVGLVPMRNGYFACDVDASGKTLVLSYETNVDALYTTSALK
jgi:eukaryotic-like serine/threonine-protein kinase